MAKIVLGLAMAHGPTLNTPSDQWTGRATADRRNPALFFDGQTWGFDALVERRKDERLGEQLDPALMRERYESVQQAVEALGETLRQVKPDVAVIVGNDQQEIFRPDQLSAFLVHWGKEVRNGPHSSSEAPGLAVADWGYYPDEAVTYAGVPDLGRHLIRSLMDQGFDVSQSEALPPNRRTGNQTTPHAFGFVYRRVMKDQVLPHVPVFINTFYPPNQPSMRRCYAFGRALGRAIRAWPEDRTVAVIASGGLTHFVIEEALDREVLDALASGDGDRISALPTERFESGNSEIRSWVATAGAMAEANLGWRLVDYVPCYRTEAGTGQAAGFAEWC